MKNLLVSLIAAFTLSVSVNAAEVSPPAKPVIPAVIAKPAAQDIININTADVQTLTKLKGIGPKKAEAIVAWRKANGNFKTVDQLADVKGIGAKMLDALRKNIRI